MKTIENVNIMLNIPLLLNLTEMHHSHLADDESYQQFKKHYNGFCKIIISNICDLLKRPYYEWYFNVREFDYIKNFINEVGDNNKCDEISKAKRDIDIIEEFLSNLKKYISQIAVKDLKKVFNQISAIQYDFNY